MGTLKYLDEGYGPNYTGALGFQKMESHIWIYAYEFDASKERLLIMLHEWTECSYYDMFLWNSS